MKGHYFDDDDLVQEEDKAYINPDAHKSTYLCSTTPPFTPIKVKKDFGHRNGRLGNALFPQRQLPIASRIPLKVQEKGKRRLFKEEDALPSKPTSTFDDVLGDYISLKDPIGLLVIDFLPSIETLALLDHVGRRRDQLFLKPTRVFRDVLAAHMMATNIADDIAGNNDGVAKAELLGRPTLKSMNGISTGPTLIDLSSDDNDDNYKIVYSIPGTSVQHTGGKMSPPIRSIASVVVKMEPSSPREPNSPSLWGDVTTQEEASESMTIICGASLSIHQRQWHILRPTSHLHSLQPIRIAAQSNVLLYCQ